MLGIFPNETIVKLQNHVVKLKCYISDFKPINKHFNVHSFYRTKAKTTHLELCLEIIGILTRLFT